MRLRLTVLIRISPTLSHRDMEESANHRPLIFFNASAQAHELGILKLEKVEDEIVNAMHTSSVAEMTQKVGLLV